MRRPSRARLGRLPLVVLVAGVVVAVAGGAYAASPRTEGLSGDWSAPSTDGDVVAGRALVSAGSSALDLRTGKSIRLGSVVGGVAAYADDRLLVVKEEQVDSARLDASARWTWRAPAGHSAIPLAAAGGSTLVADCPADTRASCRLVGLDGGGKQSWESTGADRPVGPPRPSLPRIHAQSVEGGGVLLTDPLSGRSTLQPGTSFTAVPDGPVIVPVQQGGQCVVSLFTSPDPLWTKVLGPCPGGRVPRVSVTDDAVVLSWPGTTERLATDTGATLPRPAATASVRGVVASSAGTVATRHTAAAFLDPRRWGKDEQVLALRDARSGEVRAQLVTHEPVAVLLLEPGALVVREGDQVIRYTLDD